MDTVSVVLLQNSTDISVLFVTYQSEFFFFWYWFCRDSCFTYVNKKKRNFIVVAIVNRSLDFIWSVSSFLEADQMKYSYRIKHKW